MLDSFYLKSAGVQIKKVAVLILLYKARNFMIWIACLVRAMDKALDCHAGGPGLIPVDPQALFSFKIENSSRGLLIR